VTSYMLFTYLNPTLESTGSAAAVSCEPLVPLWVLGFAGLLIVEFYLCGRGLEVQVAS
jgi:hypothetical protein